MTARKIRSMCHCCPVSYSREAIIIGLSAL
jgi:hypothetical protein